VMVGLNSVEVDHAENDRFPPKWKWKKENFV
jgi:hypothetical protein